jgi:hypothetical protein
MTPLTTSQRRNEIMKVRVSLQSMRRFVCASAVIASLVSNTHLAYAQSTWDGGGTKRAAARSLN